MSELDVEPASSNFQIVAAVVADSFRCCVQPFVKDHTVVKRTEPLATGSCGYVGNVTMLLCHHCFSKEPETVSPTVGMVSGGFVWMGV